MSINLNLGDVRNHQLNNGCLIAIPPPGKVQRFHFRIEKKPKDPTFASAEWPSRINC